MTQENKEEVKESAPLGGPSSAELKGKEKGVVNTEVSVEMKKAYLDYAMSVIVSRAIPRGEFYIL